ncbi:Na+/H+ antiporter subunit E [Cellulomonas sp. P24]|uniref:Na+/H+ antiporter subunit E n=1 Tax=Cellulomonas sp. P24 TaxID=2885206 RepID=UPI00216AF9DD|nr:Na+/H+ antiporter subunit E [Cellulomonas sp. P24]MCR6492702.1 Na+/H+ antiporter subunit E [Cellulomonas sp. P24]
MTLHRHRRHLAMHALTYAWMVAVWVLLWGDLSIANVLVGAGLAFVITTVLPMPPIDFHGRVRPLGMLRLLGHFAVEVTRASFQVSVIALTPGRTPRGAVIGVRLRSHSDLYLTITAELASLVPGSLVIEAHRLTGMLYLHLLDVTTAAEAEAHHAAVLGLEERVMRALASDDELIRAGLPVRRPTRGARR